MKNDLPEPDDDEVIATECFDWKAGPDEILEAVDRLLVKHNLEIHNYDTGADFYQFSIQRRD